MGAEMTRGRETDRETKIGRRSPRENLYLKK